MNWVDVCGFPGAGKSTLCEEFWPNRWFPEKVPEPNAHGHDFYNEVSRLLSMMSHREDDLTALVRMNRRTNIKMAAVAQLEDMDTPYGATYIQTGFVQRGLGFGWRMVQEGMNLDELRHYFRLMPVSIGIVIADCSVDCAKGRNKEREKNPATAHENRTFQVELMAPVLERLPEWLERFGIPFTKISTEQPIEEARKEIKEVAGFKPIREVRYEPAISRPVWW